MSLPGRRPLLTCYHWECGSATFETVAPDMDEGFERACREAAARGLHDCPLRCVDVEEDYDPTGGDGPDD
jgi:hypothetical protein